ncbi:MAG TPA: hypothetical protein VIO58_02720 [Candidatus Methanoperedens sp.]
MRRAFILFILLIMWWNAAAAQSIFTVEVNVSGNALWTIEKRLPFEKSQLNEWEAALKKGENISKPKEVAEINETVNLFVRSSQNFTNRSMYVEEFNASNITYDIIKTLSDGFGVIRYRFVWNNFSFTNSSTIYVGDAFSEGLPLSADNILIIEIPDGYNVQNATPAFDKRDGNRLIWDRTLYRNFSAGEPALVLNRTNVTALAEGPAGNTNLLPLAIVAIGVIVLIMALAFFWYRKHSQDPGEGNGEIKEGEQSETGGDITLTQPPLLNEEFLGYEDMIERFLMKSGGQAFQSAIVKESGLSKSKISVVLAQMKEEGRVLKIRKGKENIVRLVKKTEIMETKEIK